MGFKLEQNKVYATNPTNLGTISFQPVNGNAQLYGTNVTRYSSKNGEKRIVVPSFDELVLIWDDWLQKDTVNPMTALTSFIGFKSDNPETELWVNGGIDIKITPPFDILTGQ